MPVDRCVCFDVTFARLKAFADEHGGGIEKIHEQFGCGKGCALCIPYVKAMLRTGQTSFPPGQPPPDASDLSC